MKHKLLIIILMCMMPLPSFSQYFEDPDDQDQDQIKWQLHESKSGSFTAKFPEEYKYKIFPFQFNGDKIAFATEILAPLNGGKIGQNNTVSIKSTHTFGGSISQTRAKNILKRESNKYLSIAKTLNAHVLTNEPIKHKGFLGQKIHMTFDSEGEKHGIRLHIFLTNHAIIEMIVTAPKESLYSYRIDDFFDSITPLDGIVSQENPIGTGWIPLTSKNNTFTAKIPPKNREYTAKPAFFQATPRIERMKYEVTDPVLKYRSFFNVTTYKLGRKVTKKNVHSILFQKHVSVYAANASKDSLNLEESIVDGVKTLRSRLILVPPKALPYLNTMSIEAQFVGDFVIVKEFLSGPQHARSGLAATFFSQVDFHPKKYKVAKKENKDKAP